MARRSGQVIPSVAADPAVDPVDADELLDSELESDDEPQSNDAAEEFTGELHQHPELLSHLEAAKAATYNPKTGEGNSVGKEEALARAVEFLKKVESEFGPKSEVADKVRREINVARGVK